MPALSHRLLRSSLLAGGALLAGAVTLAGPASAQFYGYGYGAPAPYSYNAPPPAYGPRPYGGGPYGRGPYGRGPYGDESDGQARTLPARAIVDRLEDMGYEDIGRPRFTGTIYVVDATAPGDIRVRVVVDAVRGVVLNRTALGDRRDGRPGDDIDEDRPAPRRYGGRPREAEPGLLEDGPQARREIVPERGSVARGQDLPSPPESAPASRGLPGPADPRLSPSGERAARTFEGRSSGREAARTEPAPGPIPADPSARPYGTNPGGTNPGGTPGRRTPADQQQARRPSTTAVPPRPPAAPAASPDGTRAGGTEPNQATADAGPRQNRPVRVIGGVTPMNGDGASSGAAQLDALPQPPSTPTPAVPE